MKTVFALVLLMAVPALADDAALVRRVEKLERDMKVMDEKLTAALQQREIFVPDKPRAEKPRPEQKPFRSQYWRSWQFTDGSKLDAELYDFAKGEAVLLDDTGESHQVKTSELSPSDRRFVQEFAKARTEIERAKSAGVAKDCPNPNCKRGVVYGRVEGAAGGTVGGSSFAHGMSGIGPIGQCPVCNGKGVVPKK
jgi:hypothetical protein